MTLSTTFIQHGGKEDGYFVFVGGQFVGARPTHPKALELRDEEALKLARADRAAERVRREAELFGGCRVCGFDHLTTGCPEIAAERRRQEEDERR
jgi:hypothetical protein